MMQKKSSKDVLRETQREWTEKLKTIDLNDLNPVRVFDKGAYAHVTLVQLSGEPDMAFALKTIQKSKVKSQIDREHILSEKKILTEIQSDFIAKLYRTFKNTKYLYFLLEYCPGGNLFDKTRFCEADARFYIACIVEALDCLHSANVAHNDLKPDNVVLDSEGYLKVIDMGLARKIQRGKLWHSLEGTTAYLPPEVVWSKLNKNRPPDGRDRAVDLWAVGVILYEFLRGQQAFVEYNDKLKTRLNIMVGFKPNNFSKRFFSADAEDLIQKLCANNPWHRLGYRSIEEIRKHRWFKDFNWDSLRNRELKPPMVPEVYCAVDTHHFDDDVDVTPDSDVEEDKSDWDNEF